MMGAVPQSHVPIRNGWRKDMLSWQMLKAGARATTPVLQKGHRERCRSEENIEYSFIRLVLD